MRLYTKLSCALGVYAIALSPVYDRGREDALRSAAQTNGKPIGVLEVPVVEYGGERFVVDPGRGQLFRLSRRSDTLDSVLDTARALYDRITPEALSSQ